MSKFSYFREEYMYLQNIFPSVMVNKASCGTKLKATQFSHCQMLSHLYQLWICLNYKQNCIISLVFLHSAMLWLRQSGMLFILSLSSSLHTFFSISSHTDLSATLGPIQKLTGSILLSKYSAGVRISQDYQESISVITAPLLAGVSQGKKWCENCEE